MRRIIHPFAIVERVLRDRISYFAEIARSEALSGKIADLLIVTTLSLAVFGFVAGLSGRNLLQALISTIKLPFLFFTSGVICLPTLYYFSILFGSRLRFLQTITLILTAQIVAAVLAVGTVPISLLFLWSGSEPMFMVALNTSALSLAAALGLIFLVQGALYIQELEPPQEATFFTWARLFGKGSLRALVLASWIVVYALVGTQLGYKLRPFFGVPIAGHDFWSILNNVVEQVLTAGR